LNNRKTYTFPSQYTNNPHPCWEEFDRSVQQVLTTTLGSELPGMLEVYQKYIEMKNPPLYFKFLYRVILFFHQNYYSSKAADIAAAKYEGGKRVYAYMGERLMSIFCHYLINEEKEQSTRLLGRRIYCKTMPVSCYKCSNENITRIKHTKEDKASLYRQFYNVLDDYYDQKHPKSKLCGWSEPEFLNQELLQKYQRMFIKTRTNNEYSIFIEGVTTDDKLVYIIINQNNGLLVCDLESNSVQTVSSVYLYARNLNDIFAMNKIAIDYNSKRFIFGEIGTSLRDIEIMNWEGIPIRLKIGS
jgi:hypothetical protein